VKKVLSWIGALAVSTGWHILPQTLAQRIPTSTMRYVNL
jgi:hypothetical protein